MVERGESTAPDMAETDIPSHGYRTAPIIYQAAMDYSFLFGVGPHQAALRNHSLEIKLRLALCKANILPAVLSLVPRIGRPAGLI